MTAPCSPQHPSKVVQSDDRNKAQEKRGVDWLSLTLKNVLMI